MHYSNLFGINLSGEFEWSVSEVSEWNVSEVSGVCVMWWLRSCAMPCEVTKSVFKTGLA